MRLLVYLFSLFISLFVYLLFISQFIFFYEKILSVKKHQNAKRTTFTILEVLCTQKLAAFIIFYSLAFIFISLFWFDLRFCKFKIFS